MAVRKKNFKSDAFKKEKGQHARLNETLKKKISSIIKMRSTGCLVGGEGVE